MRMSLARAAAYFGLVILSAGGCEVGDASIPGGGGDNGDDGISNDDGDGTTDGLPGPDAADLPDPSLVVAVDKPSISTELMTENMVTLNLQGADGFEGAVGIIATVVDTAGAPLADWQVQLSDSTVNLTANGSGTVVATLSIPGDAAALTGRIKFDITSPLVAAQTAQTDVTALNQVSVPVKLNAGGNSCEYPTGLQVRVRSGTKVRFANVDTVPNHTFVIHLNPNGTGMNHQPDGSIVAPGAAYEQTAGGGGTATWYCHDKGPDTDNPVQVVE